MPRKVTTKSHIKQRPAPDRTIERWVHTICANGDDSTAHMSALLLLLDEIERSSQDRVEGIVWIARTAAFCKSAAADKAARSLVEELRAQGCMIKAA